MRKMMGAAFVFAVTVVPAYGLGPPIQDGMFLSFLASRGVQEDLKLTPEQVKEVTEIRGKRMRKPPEFRQLTREEQRQVKQELDKKDRETLTKLLTPEQLKRLHQIWLQYRGPLACLNDDIAKEMGLTAEQKNKLWSVRQQLIDGLVALPSLSREAAAGKKRAEMESKVRTDTAAKVMAILTPEQKAKWREMTGQPFDVELHIFTVGARPQRQPQQGKKKTGS
jgi:Spy/CpxP family protein refolding chaperone